MRRLFTRWDVGTPDGKYAWKGRQLLPIPSDTDGWTIGNFFRSVATHRKMLHLVRDLHRRFPDSWILVERIEFRADRCWWLTRCYRYYRKHPQKGRA